MVQRFKNCPHCGKPNRFLTCNNYTPVRLRKRCMRCKKDMIYDIERKKEEDWENMVVFENELAAQNARMTRRQSNYMRSRAQ